MSQPTITPKVADSNKKSNTSKSVSKVKTPKPPKPPKVKEVQPALPLIPISKLPPPLNRTSQRFPLPLHTEEYYPYRVNSSEKIFRNLRKCEPNRTDERAL